jgi:hypothetical protein
LGTLDRLERAVRQVIEVHVRNHRDVDRRQELRKDSRLDEALGHLPHGVREDRIGHDELVVHLHERRGVADPQDGEARVGPLGTGDARRDLARRRDERGRVAPRHFARRHARRRQRRRREDRQRDGRATEREDVFGRGHQK